MHDDFFKNILRKDQTVFSFVQLLQMNRGVSVDTLKSRVNYYSQRGDLYHIRRGLYAKDAQYDRLELGTRILTPAYISFETVLGAAGVTFQYYNQIFVASYQSREIECDGQLYTFKRIKMTVLVDTTGIIMGSQYFIATPERAFLDVVYLNKRYHFDNFDPLDWDKVYTILPIYRNKAMEKRVALYHQSYKDEME